MDTLKDTVVNILSDGEQLTAREIAELFKYKNREYFKKKLENKGSEKDAIRQIAAEISSYYAKGDLTGVSDIITSQSPKKLYITKSVKTSEKEEEKKEVDLYPVLRKWLNTNKNILSMRIDEKSSAHRGKGANKWLFPDIVGVKNIAGKWGEFRRCADNSQQLNLYSFEVKTDLTLSNVREYFFQTVANSSWANYSYLVARSSGGDANDELTLLCERHHVGVILLGDDDRETSVFIPAPRHDRLDWGMINRIAETNTDFQKFIGKVRNFYSTGSLEEDTPVWQI